MRYKTSAIRMLGVVLLFMAASGFSLAQDVATWTVRYEAPGRYDHPRDVAFFDSARGIATVAWGVVVTSDGGSQWTPQRLVDDTSRMQMMTSVAIVDRNTAWVCGHEGMLFVTTDGGETFEDRSMPEEYDMEGMFFLDERTGWICGDSSSNLEMYGQSCILKTTDGGQTWAVANMMPPWRLDPTIWTYWTNIKFTDENNGWVVAPDGVVARTKDGGYTWEIFLPANGRDLFALHVYSPEHVLIGGENQFLVETTDGGLNWTERPRMPHIGVYYDIDIDASGKGYICGGARTFGVFRTEDNGVTWQPETLLADKSRYVAAITRMPDGNMWAVTDEGEILERVPNGSTGLETPASPAIVSLTAWPNPIPKEGSLQVLVSVAAAGPVRLDLISIDGRRIATLYDGVLPVGEYALAPWSAKLAPGMYILELRSAGGRNMSKLLVTE